jgi:hypothetical protein
VDFLIHQFSDPSYVANERPLLPGERGVGPGGLAYGLRCAGLQWGDRIGIYLAPSVPQALAIFCISQVGGVFVPINGLLFPEQMAHIAIGCVTSNEGSL